MQWSGSKRSVGVTAALIPPTCERGVSKGCGCRRECGPRRSVSVGLHPPAVRTFSVQVGLEIARKRPSPPEPNVGLGSKRVDDGQRIKPSVFRDELGYPQSGPWQVNACPAAHPEAFSHAHYFGTTFFSIDQETRNSLTIGTVTSRYQTPGGDNISHRIPTDNRLNDRGLSVEAWLRAVQPRSPFCPPIITSAASATTALAEEGSSNSGGSSRVRAITGWMTFEQDGGALVPDTHGGAVDYIFRSIIDSEPVLLGPVRAMADGHVVWKGFNPSAGNVLIIEYPNGGEPYRSTYHHLVDGLSHDLYLAARGIRAWCRGAGSRRSACQADGNAETYIQEASANLATVEQGGRAERKWGTNAMHIRVDVGDPVRIGQVVGFAGDTGYGSGGIHLHAGLAKRVEATVWDFVDPYGIYSTRDCYEGLYPSGRDPANGQHPSMFCPLLPTFAGASRRLMSLALTTYSRVQYSPVAICAYAGGVRWAGAFRSDEMGSRRVRLGLGRAALAGFEARWSDVPVHVTIGDGAEPVFYLTSISAREAEGRGIRFVSALRHDELQDLVFSPKVAVVDACLYFVDGAARFTATTSRQPRRGALGSGERADRFVWDLSLNDLRRWLREQGAHGIYPLKIQPYLRPDAGPRFMCLASGGAPRSFSVHFSELLSAEEAVQRSVEGQRPISVVAVQVDFRPLIATVYELSDEA